MFYSFFRDERLTMLHRLVDLALEEDGRDLTSEALFPPDSLLYASIVAKQDSLVAGLPLAAIVLERMGCACADVTLLAADGDAVERGREVARILGSAPVLLKAERVIMNFICHLSGVANATRSFVQAVEGTGVRVLDTRKTSPGQRYLEKYAVRLGGGRNHRGGLFDGVLIKNNHLTAVGSITEAVRRARRSAPHTLKIEVEVTSLAELEEALGIGADVIMLDNMSDTDMAKAADLTLGRALLEASGSMTLERLPQVAATRVNFISVGRITHSAPAVDIHLRLIKTWSQD